MTPFYKSNTFLAIVSIVIAILLWIYVVYEVSPMHEATISDIPVKCINVNDQFEDGSLVITGDNENLLKGAAKIDITVRAKRNVISSINAKSFSCTIDMISVNQHGSFSLRPIIEHNISGLEILKTSPYNFKVTAEDMEQKDIKIKVKTTGALPDGYSIEDIDNHNESVKITGASSVIDKVKKAEVVFDYDELSPKDSEKSYKIEFFDGEGRALNSDVFKKTIEYAKLSFKLYTTKEVSLVLMPKYADEVNKNHYGKSVSLKLVGDGTSTEDGGLELKLKLKGTAAALEKYTDLKRIVYTEDIDVSNIYKDTEIDEIKAAELVGDVSYVKPPVVKVKISVGV